MRTIACIIMILVKACQPNVGGDVSDRDLVAVHYDRMEEAIAAPRTAEPPMPPVVEENTQAEEKIIKNGSINFEVPNLENAKSRIDSIIRVFDAYYEQEQFNAYQNHKSYYLIIRLPGTKFEQLISMLENGISGLSSKNLSADNVTQEFVDLNIRLENKLAYIKQYRNILNSAKSVKDILDIQEKIRNLEEEIDATKGRLKYLNDRVSLSTLTIHISEKDAPHLVKQPTFIDRTIKSFQRGWKSLVNVTLAFIEIWPFIILLFLVYYNRDFIRRKLPIGRKNDVM